MNLIDLFSIAGWSDRNKTALQFRPSPEVVEELSFADLDQASRRLAVGLVEWGLERGDRVAFFMGNRPEFIVAYLAVIRLGAVMVPMNLAYRRRELAHILGDARPRLLLTEEDRLPVLAELAPEDLDGVEELLPAERLAAMGGEEAAAFPKLVEGDPAVIMYTSGTTGRSKGAVITHGNLVATVNDLLTAWAWSSDDTLLLTLPLFHVHGLVVGLHCALAAGATVQLRRRFGAAAVADEIESGEPTLFFGVPTMYRRLAEEIRTSSGGLDASGMRLFCSGSAPLPEDLFREFRELSAHTILERYGMTETGMLLSNPYTGDRVAGSVGLPLPGVSARIVDQEGKELPPGSEGELLVRGDNVFERYWEAPEKTAASFSTDGDGHRWFHTGDLARQDPENGYFELLGRRHELIISGGYNIYPRELEELLCSHPGVREAAVVGRSHPEWGQVPAAFLVAAGEIDLEALKAWCRQEMAGFKVPQVFHLVPSLPRNALGKVQKHLLEGDGSS